jgi:hypothetical protein
LKPNVLIPLSTVALAACGPAFVGDFDLTSFTLSYDGDAIQTTGATGSLAVDKELATALRVNWTYDGYALAITLDGDAEEGDDDAFSLDLTGSVSYDGDSYAATGELECTIDGDDVDCDGTLRIDDEPYAMTAAFTRE